MGGIHRKGVPLQKVLEQEFVRMNVGSRLSEVYAVEVCLSLG